MTTDLDIWMVHPGILDPAQSMGLRDRFLRNRGVVVEAEVERVQSVAVIRVDGLISRRPDIMQAYFDGVSSESLLETINRLASDDSVSAIVARVDTPGGEQHRMPELAAAVKAAAEQKPFIVQIEGGCYSGGLYFAANATAVYCLPSDRIGSMGTIHLARDMSKLFAEAGVEVIATTNADAQYKSLGYPGVPFSQTDREYLQQKVDEMHADFDRTVQQGRGLSDEQMKPIRTAGVFSASQAVEIGLVDAIQTYEETMENLLGDQPMSKSATKTADTNQATPAPSEPTVQQPATFAELQARFPNAEASFVVQCQTEKLTLDQAIDKHMANQQSRIDELTQKAEEDAKQQAEDEVKRDKLAQVTAGQGVDASQAPAPSTGLVTKAAGSEFEQLVQQHVDSGMSKTDATRQAIRTNPAAHKQYIRDYTAQHQQETPDAA